MLYTPCCRLQNSRTETVYGRGGDRTVVVQHTITQLCLLNPRRRRVSRSSVAHAYTVATDVILFISNLFISRQFGLSYTRGVQLICKVNTSISYLVSLERLDIDTITELDPLARALLV